MQELEDKIVEFAKERDWLQFNTPENFGQVNCNRSRGIIRMLSVE